MKRKLLTILLSLMMISMIAVNVLAEDFSTGWTTLTSAGGTLNEEKYYLKDDVLLTNNITVSGEVTIDLNGHILKGVGTDSVITVSSGKLIIQDSNSTVEHAGYVDAHGLWHPGTGHSASKTIAGGVITGGTGKLNGSEYLGGGVYVDSNGTFVMNGGTIAGCKANKGGGVYTWGNFTMNNNSAIIGCIATIDGGGVCACNNSFIMNNNSKISECIADNGGGGVYTWAASGKSASFTMNDNSTISNCNARANNTSKERSGGGVCVENSTFTINGGTITANTVNGNVGGGVHVFSGTFNMTNGTIDNNTATYGGGIHDGSGAQVNITNGAIKNNNASQSGGGIQVDGTLTMSGGNIENNSANGDAGGLSVKGAVTLNGTAKILNNTANGSGGGINYYGGSGNLTLGGSVQITGNVKGGTISGNTLSGGTANNVCLFYNYNFVTIDTATNDMQIGITTNTTPTGNNPVKITTNGTANDANHFFSDNANYRVTFKEDHLELFIPQVAYNFTKYINYSSLAEAISDSDNGDVIELWANENAESIVLPIGVTLYAKSGYTGTVTTSETGKTVVKLNMLGNFQYKFSVANVLNITYKDQGNRSFSGTHETGYPTTFVAEVPTELKAATKDIHTFGGWFDNADCTGDPITGFYADYTDDLTLYAKWTKNPSSYQITKGNNAKINIDENRDFSFTSDALYEKFNKVKVDDVLLTENTDYVVEEGSTKVTLEASYLNGLSVGQHTIDIISDDGYASTTFIIKKNSPSPKPKYIVPNTGVK